MTRRASASPSARSPDVAGTAPAFNAGWRANVGLLRSVLIYHAVPFKIRRLARLYRPFVRPGDLCFDIGAHVGDRTRAFLRLGARVVAVEPQPVCAGFLERYYGNDRRVILLRSALGAVDGKALLHLSERTPTVSSASPQWIERVRRAPRFARVTWDRQVPVEVTTLDSLIERFGLPAFTKIDVEGGEPDVLQGLSRALPALSFDYIPVTRASTEACLARLEVLGDYEYNWTEREDPRLRSTVWLTAEAIGRAMVGLPDGAHSGDIYSRLKSSG